MSKQTKMLASILAVALTFAGIVTVVVVDVNSDGTSDNSYTNVIDESGVTDDAEIEYLIPAIFGDRALNERITAKMGNIYAENTIDELMELINDMIVSLHYSDYIAANEDSQKIFELLMSGIHIERGQMERLMELASETLEMDRIASVIVELPIIDKCFKEGNYVMVAALINDVEINLIHLSAEFTELYEKWSSNSQSLPTFSTETATGNYGTELYKVPFTYFS